MKGVNRMTVKMFGLVVCIGLLLCLPFAGNAGATLNFVVYEDIAKNVRVVADKFEESHPDIHINIMSYPFTQMFEVIETKMRAHDPSIDILLVDQPLVMNYTVKGYLEPLDKYFTIAEAFQFTERSLEASLVNGKFMVAPLNSSSVGMFINLDLFKEHGIPIPSTDPAERLTWEEVVEIAKKLTLDTDGDGDIDVWGLAFDQFSLPYQMLPLAQSLGGVGIGPDGLTATGYINTEPWIKAAQFYQDLFWRYKVSPLGVHPFESPALFAAGKIAMLVTGPWHTPEFNEVKDLHWIYVPHPYFKEGKPVTPTGSWHLGISVYSKHKDEAAKFVKFITLGEPNKLYYELSRDLPANKKTLEWIQETAKKDDPMLLAIYESTHTAMLRPKTPGYMEWHDEMFKAFEDIRNGLDPKTVLDQAAARIDKLLAKYRQ